MNPKGGTSDALVANISTEAKVTEYPEFSEDSFAVSIKIINVLCRFYVSTVFL